jgi:hypothetical protein
VAVCDWPRCCSIDPDVNARAIWLAGSQETWVRNWEISIHARKVLLHGTDGFTSPPKKVVLRILITIKNPSTSVGIEPAHLGSSGEHANH